MSPRRGSHRDIAQPDAGENTKPSLAEQARADRVRVAGEVIRAVRRSLGYSRDELRTPLRVGPASLARYELGDAPPWMQYALIGVGVLERGIPVDEMVRRVAAAETAAAEDPARGAALGPAASGDENC